MKAVDQYECAWESAICDFGQEVVFGDCGKAARDPRMENYNHMNNHWTRLHLRLSDMEVGVLPLCFGLALVHGRVCCKIYECVRNMAVIPLFGDFSCRSVGIAKRQHDWPSLTLISDAVDSQTRCTFSHLGAAQQSITVQTERKQSGVSRKF